ncbi:3-oxoacyl-ACP reductase [Virgisporangium aliadipatigenens]|uniref:3-oxoacyl-ACP reductase n=1 Tax=Virgisporangium aliadipatigenens TaxID=741659 RepID=A0A8J3YUM9_9ACTN|nr:3-oxoacyl-ACP reductase [Virgisporangium aliadipatigenens]GIJ52004.1 3-oxoacyl-ACP reductase [Virgisporangium aliadipatigenens]
MDRYSSFANSRAGRLVVRGVGLPRPPVLRRYTQGEPDPEGPFLIGGSGRLAFRVIPLLAGTQKEGERPRAVVCDATGVTDPAGLAAVYSFVQPAVRDLLPNGRVLVLGTPPARCGSPAEAAAQQALEGFVRSVGKEIGRRGGTANLAYVAPGAENAAESTVRFLLSTRSAFVSGQVVAVEPAPAEPAHGGPVAVVTGAARGIGLAIVGVLARAGARVVAVDLPSAGAELAAVANDVRGASLQLDLTAERAPQRLVRYLTDRYGRLDVLVHNAGITRDRTLAKMSPQEWDAVLRVNLAAPAAVTEAVLAGPLMPAGGRIVCVSSVSGIAGNRGQANYAASKAGLIGLVRSLAPTLANRGVTANAVAPGFIETDMTARMPMTIREAGRRLNSVTQGGRPIDVAETVGWLAEPGSGGVTGNVVRVCGQSLLGA